MFWQSFCIGYEDGSAGHLAWGTGLAVLVALLVAAVALGMVAKVLNLVDKVPLFTESTAGRCSTWRCAGNDCRTGGFACDFSQSGSRMVPGCLSPHAAEQFVETALCSFTRFTNTADTSLTPKNIFLDKGKSARYNSLACVSCGLFVRCFYARADVPMRCVCQKLSTGGEN